MSHVSVTIHGRQYRMACEDGQEDHLVRLAKDLDQRIEQLKASFGAIGDMRLIVMAALTLGDELSEAAKRVRRLEEELSALQDARVASSERAQAMQVAVANALNSASERIEQRDAQPEPKPRRGRRDRVARSAPNDGGGNLPAHPLHCRSGAAVFVGYILPGPYDPKGAVPGRARGSGHMAPTYFCRFPGSKSDGSCGSALLSLVVIRAGG